MPWKQDDASVAKYTVEKQLQRAQQGDKTVGNYVGHLIQHRLEAIRVSKVGCVRLKGPFALTASFIVYNCRQNINLE